MGSAIRRRGIQRLAVDNITPAPYNNAMSDILTVEIVKYRLFLSKWLCYINGTPIVAFVSNKDLSRLHFDRMMTFIDNTIASSGGDVALSKLLTSEPFREKVERLIVKHISHADMSAFTMAFKLFRQCVLEIINESGKDTDGTLASSTGKVFDAMDIIIAETYHIDGMNRLKTMLRQLSGSGTAPLPPATIINSLTQMEYKICGLIKKGLTTKEIADRLCISGSTVQTHRKSIRKKLNITGKQNLFARLQGLG